MPNDQPKPINLDFKTPVVLTDGNGISAFGEDDTTTIVFFQIRNEREDSLDADVVSAIKLTRLQAETLNKGLSEILKSDKKSKK